MTEEEGWEFYKRLVVAQLTENREAIDELQASVRILEDQHNNNLGQMKVIAILWPTVIGIISWLATRL